MYGKEELVSVCMPVYNDQSTIKKAIESILEQTYQNFEIIISDNNSQDETFSLINQFNDSRIRSSQNIENIGWRLNSNKVMSLAKGKYVVTLHGDDYFYPGYLKEVVKIFEENLNIGIISFVSPKNKKKYFQNNSIIKADKFYTFVSCLGFIPAPTETAYLNAAIIGSNYYDKDYWTGEARLSLEIANRGYDAYICDKSFCRRDTGAVKDSYDINKIVLRFQQYCSFLDEFKDDKRIEVVDKEKLMKNIARELVILESLKTNNEEEANIEYCKAIHLIEENAYLGKIKSYLFEQRVREKVWRIMKFFYVLLKTKR